MFRAWQSSLLVIGVVCGRLRLVVGAESMGPWFAYQLEIDTLGGMYGLWLDAEKSVTAEMAQFPRDELISSFSRWPITGLLGWVVARVHAAV